MTKNKRNQRKNEKNNGNEKFGMDSKEFKS